MTHGVTFREATEHDIEAIAALHADSWRRNYRGAYSDAFLDGDVFNDRLAVWTKRLTRPPDPNTRTIVADKDGSVVGLAHTIFDADPKWGTLLDNLHVMHDLRGSGIGKQLMAETAKAVIQTRPGSALYLWVLENNTSAQAFYKGRGGTYEGRESSEAPGGGTVVGLRVVWPDPSVLLQP
jgi:ribosomal protein S18 acetylase RimI-like enzyme